MTSQIETVRRIVARMSALAAVVVLLSATAAQADSITLRAGATVSGDEIRLADVAELKGDTALAHASVIVGSASDSRDGVMIRLADVRRTLDEKGVNWGLLTLTGYSRCMVDMRVASQPADMLPTPREGNRSVVTQDHRTRSARANTRHEFAVDRAFSIEDELVALISKSNRITPDQLTVTFPRGDADLLATPRASVTCEIDPMSTNTLGRVVYAVRVWQSDDSVKQHRITAQVSRRYVAVVAKHTISRGERIERDDVEMREVMIDDDHDQPLTVLGDVVGQVAKSVVRGGTVVTSRQVEAPLMVRRGEVVSIHARAGTYLIRMEGRAKEDGAMGDTISVERERETFTVRVVGRRQVTRTVDAQHIRSEGDEG